MQDTILIICAHPDDEILGSGGSIAYWKNQGKRVISVVCSLGEGFPFWVKKKYTIALRKAESVAASKVVGSDDVIFLDMSDIKLAAELKDKQNRDKIANVIKKYQPSKIITHSLDDSVFNHQAVGHTVIDVFDSLELTNCEVYMFTVWNPFHFRYRDNIQLYVDISDYFSLKLAALKKFSSQLMVIYLLLPTTFLKAFFLGKRKKTKYCEMFVKIR